MSWQLCLRGHLLSKCQEDVALFTTTPLERIHIAALDGISQVRRQNITGFALPVALTLLCMAPLASRR